ncbi:MAG: YggS family pyridoxal phosphate-dependent enzyme [Firmicutes bacterium]|nr:YggS family pyridoxal phosphate-dependent enzyme [Bacillota bacterium]
MTEQTDRILRLGARIRAACEAAGREISTVELLPISKRQPLERIREAAEHGFARFGENYVQEGAAKAQAAPHLAFVLTGPLQRNKAKTALQHFREVMTLDRPELATRLRSLAAELDVICPVWIQLDLWNEATKLGGCPEAGLDPLIQALGHDPRLPLQGFMVLPPPGDSQAFAAAALARARWQDRLGQPLRLSMGMSDDLEEAIQAGSDQVRIGTDFFGSRI